MYVRIYIYLHTYVPVVFISIQSIGNSSVSNDGLLKMIIRFNETESSFIEYVECSNLALTTPYVHDNNVNCLLQLAQTC